VRLIRHIVYTTSTDFQIMVSIMQVWLS